MSEIRKATRQDNKAIAKVLGELITSYNQDVEIKNAVIKELEVDGLSPHSILYYENCKLFEIDNEVVGVISFYSGHLDEELTQNLIRLASKYDTLNQSEEKKVIIEDSEHGIIPQGLYISMVSVLPEFQGRKIGQELIKSVEITAKSLGYDRVSIKVDMYNPRAEDLYKRLGYLFIGEYVTNGVTLRYLEKMID